MVRSATSGPQGHAPAPQVPDRREEQHRGRTRGGGFETQKPGTAPRTNPRRPVRNTNSTTQKIHQALHLARPPLRRGRNQPVGPAARFRPGERFEAALHCGACGGHPGKANARVFASIANKPEVRSQLADNGIVIPEDTHFIAGLHDTTTDGVVIFDQVDIPASHQDDMSRLTQGLRDAAVRTNQERCARLPLVKKNPTPSTVEREINRRAGDWSEVRPEWGLSGNAAFIIGSRELSEQIDLQGRVFLNNYDYRGDSSGALLQGILAGPAVVGQWINSEHYFSATDPEVYGSGSKIYHNLWLNLVNQGIYKFIIRYVPLDPLKRAEREQMVKPPLFHSDIICIIKIIDPNNFMPSLRKQGRNSRTNKPSAAGNKNFQNRMK